VVLLRDVRQGEELREGPRDRHGTLLRQRAQRPAQGVQPAFARPAALGEIADALHRIEETRILVAREHLAQHRAEHADIGAKRCVGIGLHRSLREERRAARPRASMEAPR